MGSVRPKPRTARRGRRSGGTGMRGPCGLGKEGLARAVVGGQILGGIDANVLFGKALGLSGGWKVVKSEMDVAGRELKIWLDFTGSHFACPRCGKFSPLHDTVEKKWRHLDFWQHRTELIAGCRAPTARNTASCKPQCLGRGLAADSR